MEHRFPSSPAPKQTTGKSINTLEQPLHLSEKGTLLRLPHFHGFSEYLAAGYHQRECATKSHTDKEPSVVPNYCVALQQDRATAGQGHLKGGILCRKKTTINGVSGRMQ